jgi:hypothetical protein
MIDIHLASKGWYNSGGCGCTPKKYTWKNDSYPHHYFKVTPSRFTWELYEYDHVIARGQQSSIETQYETQFETQTA